MSRKRTASPAQIAANKANAQNSTGPRTVEGKARVAANALKHGLCSAKNPFDISTQIPGEQTHLTDLLRDFDATYQPANPVELQLVIRLAQLTLRLNRAATMESAALDKARAEALRWAEKLPHYPAPDSPDFETHILADTLNGASHQLNLLTQYESRLSRDFARTLTQLRQSQKLREQTQSAEERTANALCVVKPMDRSLANDGQIANGACPAQSHVSHEVGNNDVAPQAQPNNVARTSVCSRDSSRPQESPSTLDQPDPEISPNSRQTNPPPPPRNLAESMDCTI